MATRNVARRSVAADLSTILASPEIGDLIGRLQTTRETGRPGYPLRSMVGMALAKSLYALSMWTRTVALVREHAALAVVIAPDGNLPSVFACYRFMAKLRGTDMLEACIKAVVRAPKKANPLLGWDVAIDASDMPAYANGQRFVSNGGQERSGDEFSDPTPRGPPLGCLDSQGWLLRLPTAYGSLHEDRPSARVDRRDSARSRNAPGRTPARQAAHAWDRPETASLDEGYDNNRVYDAGSERGIDPLIPLRKTPDVKKGKDKPPCCEHGEWRFARSGAAQPANASPLPCGSRPTGCIR